MSTIEKASVTLADGSNHTVTLKEHSWSVIEGGVDIGGITKVGGQFLVTVVHVKPHLGKYVATKRRAIEAIVEHVHTDRKAELVERAAEAAWNANARTLGHETWWANVLDDPARDEQREAYRAQARAVLEAAGAL